MTEIEQTPAEVAQALRAVHEDDKDFNRYEYGALKFPLDWDREKHPKPIDGVSFEVDAEDIEMEIEKLEEVRKQCYKNNATRRADGYGFAVSALKWVLGENDTFDHVIT